MPKKLPENTLENSQKLPETLEEQRDYYLNLYQKWAKWQQETPEKLPEGFRTKEEFDFGLAKKKINDYIEFGTKVHDFETPVNSLFQLIEYDQDVQSINISVELDFLEFLVVRQIKITKEILIYGNSDVFTQTCLFDKCYGNLSITALTKHKKRIFLEFINCNFSHITLENFDLRYFSVEMIEYLYEMKKENKLTLINYKEWELPALRETLDVEKESEKVKMEVNSNRRNFSFKANDQTKAAFVRYFSGFQRFIQTAKGRKIGFELANTNGTIDLTIYSDNQNDLDEMDVWLNQFISYAYDFVTTGKLSPIDVDFDKTSDYDRKISLVEYEFRVSDLRNQLKIAHLDISQMQEEMLKLTEQKNLLFIELENIKKPTLCVEGEIDKIYLQKAAQLLGFVDLFQKVEILTLNGESELKKIWSGYSSQQFNIGNLHKKVLLLFDCDVSFPDWQEKGSKLYAWRLPKLDSLIQKGVENLFESSLILEAKKYKTEFVDKTKLEIRGKESTKYEINSDEKRNFCRWLIGRENANDFVNFGKVLKKIEEVLT